MSLCEHPSPVECGRSALENVVGARNTPSIARFGVGYDTVDVPACTANDIALVITPDGVRRPVAVSILTFILAILTIIHTILTIIFTPSPPSP